MSADARTTSDGSPGDRRDRFAEADEAARAQLFGFAWVPAGNGRLALWHRPRIRAIPHLRAAGCDRVATALSEREGADEIGEAVRRAGLVWSWIPLDSGRPPVGRLDRIAREGLDELHRHLREGASILLHCSAGMHRTGTLAYALFRLEGLGREAALARVEAARPVTRTALGEGHLAWGDEVAGDG